MTFHLLGVIFLLFYFALLLVLWLFNPEIAKEDDLMENQQAMALAIGVLISSSGLFLPDSRYPRFVFYVLTSFLLALFLREVDIDRFDLPGILIALGSGSGRNLLLAGAALFVLALFAKDYRTLGPAVRLFCGNGPAIPFIWVSCFILPVIYLKTLVLLVSPDKSVSRGTERECRHGLLLVGCYWLGQGQAP